MIVLWKSGVVCRAAIKHVFIDEQPTNIAEQQLNMTEQQA